MALSSNVLVLLDILLSLFFVGPFTVLYWRGTFVTIYNFFMSGLLMYECYCVFMVDNVLRCSIVREVDASHDAVWSWSPHEDTH